MKRILALLAALLLLGAFHTALAADMAERGAFRLDYFQGGAMGIQFIDVTVDEEGADLCVWTNRDVLGLRLEQITWDDMRQAEVRPLYTADVLSSNQVLRIRTYLPEVMPTLCVSGWVREGADERFECWYIMDSGEDGSLMLMNAQELGLPMPARQVAAEMRKLSWLLSSGVGAWHTELSFGFDGFFGIFEDADMGDAAEEYPLGTVYGCEFEGDSYVCAQLADTVYELAVSGLETTAVEDVLEGIRILPGTPYGVEQADKLLVYLPGTPVADLPEGFRTWALLADIPLDGETLPCWGLYNAAEDLGFIGTDYQDPMWADEIDGHPVASWSDETGTVYPVFVITDMTRADDGRVTDVTGVYYRMSDDDDGYQQMPMDPVTYAIAPNAQFVMYQTLNVPVDRLPVDDLGQWFDIMYDDWDDYAIETRISLNDTGEIVYMIGYMMPWD